MSLVGFDGVARRMTAIVLYTIMGRTVSLVCLCETFAPVEQFSLRSFQRI